MLKVAVIGAKGFIGGRTTQLLAERDGLTVVPVVRPGSQGRFGQAPNLEPREADALDLNSLAAGLNGCDVAVHCVAGNPWLIVKSAEVAYRAAQQAGVKRLVYLSTASVHGQAPTPGTHDDSPLSSQQFLAYNNAKVKAEQALQALSTVDGPELVRIRPGIVFGPGSMWTTGFAHAVLDHTAYLVNGGAGICNSVYIDNLVHGIYLAATVPGVGGEAFIVGDEETVTWRNLYEPLAQAVGAALNQIPDLSLETYRPSTQETLREGMKNSALLSQLVFTLKNRRAQQGGPRSAMRVSQPSLNYEMAQLYLCTYKLPHAKAAERLGYAAPVAFAQGCAATAEHLQQSTAASTA